MADDAGDAFRGRRRGQDNRGEKPFSLFSLLSAKRTLRRMAAGAPARRRLPRTRRVLRLHAPIKRIGLGEAVAGGQPFAIGVLMASGASAIGGGERA